jgi:predicted DNA-binding transcriptional regulator AlpA
MRTGRLMAMAEIGRRLGVSRTRTKQLIARPDWPAPHDELDVGRIWLAADIEQWIAEHRPPLDDDE